GEETPLDAALVEVAAEALGHLVRNAIVHGIEDPETRADLGKPSEGTVLLTASVRGRWVDIEVLDDGGGIDYERLRKAAERQGIEVGSDADLHGLVFRSGLTTRVEADQSSGRGVGTAAVLEAVHRYGGTIDVATTSGVGSRFLLRLPLTVAVTDALALETEGVRFALPLGSILETVDAAESELKSDGDSYFIEREGINVPATDLASFLGLTETSSSRPNAVVLTSEGRLHALLIDQLGEVSTIVVNPLDPALGHPLGIAGTTVLGSGDVIMILDPLAFVGSSSEVPS
ncbi:MAG: chemotaxis protein CheW, partial [Acidimicrobiia bacterium]|nr:chemotaxis protein CheW [Acidimicrobiia bacterium]